MNKIDPLKGRPELELAVRRRAARAAGPPYGSNTSFTRGQGRAWRGYLPRERINMQTVRENKTNTGRALFVLGKLPPSLSPVKTRGLEGHRGTGTGVYLLTAMSSDHLVGRRRA